MAGAEIAEIDENLVRANLTPAQEAAAFARRKLLYEIKHPEVRHGAIGNGRAKSGNNCHSTSVDRFTAATAKAIGQSERNVRLKVQRGAALDDDAHRLVRTSLDKATELDALGSISGL